MKFDQQFWTTKYEKGLTGWDIGYVSTPIKEFADTLPDKDIKILIPGGGNSYEAEYLHNQGFRNVFVADISKEPLRNIKKRVSDFPDDHLLHIDFFELRDRFDLIIEQTFFLCAQPRIAQGLCESDGFTSESSGFVGRIIIQHSTQC